MVFQGYDVPRREQQMKYLIGLILLLGPKAR